MEKRYQSAQMEPELQKYWQEKGVYHFHEESESPIYSIDTPPPTVSGRLHLGHVYSYSHADFMARFYRMQGRNVFYPMGFDDNGLPTEHLVERKLGISAQETGRQAFIDNCLKTSVEEEKQYMQLWQRLGLSIDWRYTYRTIDPHSQKISQQSFLDLYHQDLIYRQEAPIIWCPACQTALAQADLVDITRESEFVILRFELIGRGYLEIATTRPELLPACVAIFVHPEDERYMGYIGRNARVPLFEGEVPVLADLQVDPQKGTGVVMCCTFGDQTDINWWRTYNLPLIEAVDRGGRMTAVAGDFTGLPVKQARKAIKKVLEEVGILVDKTITDQVIRAHERDDVPVEFLSTNQWFIRILDKKELWLQLGASLNWHPTHMQNRYDSWVENLNWDWCISRQRYYGVPIPVWYCADCGQVLLPSPDRLPIDPLVDVPERPCSACGSSASIAEQDVLDTWATSSLTPQIVTRWLDDDQLFKQLFPMTLRPQAHEIIRTWTFYTIVKTYLHFNQLPWQDVLISGWGIAGEGMGKISKSRGGGPMPPMEMLEKYSADAVRYWAASTGTGKDAVINEEKVLIGQKLVTKLWNLARFSQRFIVGEHVETPIEDLTGGDRWILSKVMALIKMVTEAMRNYDYAFAKNETEKFMWIFADNYLEMAKGRLYSDDRISMASAQFTLGKVLLIIIKLLAPFLPHVTEEIYLSLFTEGEGTLSVHTSQWPKVESTYFNPKYLKLGDVLVDIVSKVRRFKSQQGLSLGTPIEILQLKITNTHDVDLIRESLPDIKSVTRAENITIVSSIDQNLTKLSMDHAEVQVGLKMGSK